MLAPIRVLDYEGRTAEPVTRGLLALAWVVAHCLAAYAVYPVKLLCDPLSQWMPGNGGLETALAPVQLPLDWALAAGCAWFDAEAGWASREVIVSLVLYPVLLICVYVLVRRGIAGDRSRGWVLSVAAAIAVMVEAAALLAWYRYGGLSSWRFAAAFWDRRSFAGFSIGTEATYSSPIAYLDVPYWAVAASAAILPLLWLTRRLARRSAAELLPASPEPRTPAPNNRRRA